MKNLFDFWNNQSLIKRIIFGLIVGIILALTIPETAKGIVIFGSLFVGALKAIAPILVFFLVAAALSQHKSGHKTNMKSVVMLYAIGTLAAGTVAVVASFMFPVSLTLASGAEGVTPPSGIVEVIKSLLLNFVDNPVKALFNANYIGILAWAIILGIALRNAADSTKKTITDFSDALSKMVQWVIKFCSSWYNGPCI